jgi:hypothetical protein
MRHHEPGDTWLSNNSDLTSPSFPHYMITRRLSPPLSLFYFSTQQAVLATRLYLSEEILETNHSQYHQLTIS